MTHYFAGVDVGGTTIKVKIVDGDFSPCGDAVRPTEAGSPEKLTAAVAQTIDRALAAAGLNRRNLAAVGVGVPGQVDVEQGIVRHAVNLNIEAYPLASALAAALHCPVTIDNDVMMAAVGAYRFLNPQHSSDFCYLNVGTGVSAGIILDGRLHRGRHDMAGEIGHMVIVDDGRSCACGNRGCLEAYIAGPAIAAAGREAVAEGLPTVLSQPMDPLTSLDVYRAAAAGDEAARRITAAAGRHLGRALQILVMAYDVGQIILGGGLARAGDDFLQPVLAEWQRQAGQSPLAEAMLKPDLLSLAPADFNPGLWGALVTAREKFSEAIHAPEE